MTPPPTDAVLAGLSLAEKAALTSGTRFWYTESVERLQLPSVMLTDGPHGLRKQRAGGDHLGIGDSVPATCFPPAAALGSSWDVDLVERVGAALGTEAAHADVGVLLGPGLNIKRSPLCGRNFEYLSEDPLVSGVLAAALVAGIQSRGVGACPKHFAANNQEHDRMRVSADIDPRPLREIYLRGFQHVVTEAHPWAIMCSYNRINGVHTAEDPWLLTTVLRDEWGFAGAVVSDWGAVNDRVAALIAGLDLDMPGSAFADAQIIDALEGERRDPFMLHYNFPPYSVGEAGRIGFTSRREIGHGKLAWRALHPVLPDHEDFPYTIRILSDITESNGSSSMATVCGGCLSMMDAGVPIERPVSGIAMGLILEGEDFAVLSDILGDEDHLGDMDFKVAGSESGITSLQMDIKVAGITQEIMTKALEQAKAGRAHILGEMTKALGSARTGVSKHAPRIETMQIDKSKIRDVIGTGGKVIREIVAETGAKVDIDDEGVIKISSSNSDEIEAARKWIEGIVEEAEVGKIYNGKVVNIVDFGAFVNFMGGKDGLVHVSEMKNERVEKPTDVVSEGQEVKVKVLEIDNRGKVRLSMRVVDQETGKEIVREKREDAE